MYTQTPNPSIPEITPNPSKYFGASLDGKRYAPYICARFPIAFIIASATALVSGSIDANVAEAKDNDRALEAQRPAAITTSNT